MRVLARAYADKPLDRVLVARSPKLAYIATEMLSSTAADDSAGVGFPVNCVFEFDETLFHSLSEAWRQGDRRSLLSLWAKAHPI